MTSLTTDVSVPEAEGVHVTDDTLTAELADGRSISVPLAWYPRIVTQTSKEFENWLDGSQIVEGAASQDRAEIAERLANRDADPCATSFGSLCSSSRTSFPTSTRYTAAPGITTIGTTDLGTVSGCTSVMVRTQRSLALFGRPSSVPTIACIISDQMSTLPLICANLKSLESPADAGRHHT